MDNEFFSYENENEVNNKNLDKQFQYFVLELENNYSFTHNFSPKIL